MSLIFSRSCEYGLQALIYLASLPSGTFVLQKDISEALKIPNAFLGKILQQLTKTALIISHKGKSGGFSLGKPADEITPLEVIEAIDGTAFFENCVLGFPGCSDNEPCPIHLEWKAAKCSIIQLLSNKSIEDLGKDIDIKLKLIHKLNS
ncbi:Rrf2 family transcriptional regulator [bacterium]|nr:Rrf2 family transcriptional regulator [bacterium]